MCTICDSLGQWVCDCSRINRIGEVCECGAVRDDSYVPCVSIYVGGRDYQRMNRAQRRRRS